MDLLLAFETDEQSADFSHPVTPRRSKRQRRPVLLYNEEYLERSRGDMVDQPLPKRQRVSGGGNDEDEDDEEWLDDDASDKVPKTPKGKQGRPTRWVTPSSNETTPTKPEQTRDVSNSLGALAVRFAQYIQEAEDSTIDISQAQDELDAKRRRIYDVINILEGSGLVVRFGKKKGVYQWVGKSRLNPETGREMLKLRKEGKKLDGWIEFLDKRADKDANTNQQNRYISSPHLQTLLKNTGEDVALLALATNPGSVLHLPHDSEQSEQHSFSIFPPSKSGTSLDALPEAFLLETAGVPLRKLPLVPPPPLLTPCCSGFSFATPESLMEDFGVGDAPLLLRSTSLDILGSIKCT